MVAVTFLIAPSKALGDAVWSRRSGEMRMTRFELAEALGWIPGADRQPASALWNPSKIVRVEKGHRGIADEQELQSLAQGLGLTVRQLRSRIARADVRPEEGDSGELQQAIDGITSPEVRVIVQRIADDLAGLARSLGGDARGDADR